MAAAAGAPAPLDFPQSCLNLSRNRFQPVSTNSFDMVVSERRLSRRDVVEGGCSEGHSCSDSATVNERAQLVGTVASIVLVRLCHRDRTPHRKASGHTVSPRRGPRLRQHDEGMIKVWALRMGSAPLSHSVVAVCAIVHSDDDSAILVANRHCS